MYTDACSIRLTAALSLQKKITTVMLLEDDAVGHMYSDAKCTIANLTTLI